MTVLLVLVGLFLFLRSRDDGGNDPGPEPAPSPGQTFNSDTIENVDGMDVTENFSPDVRRYAETVKSYADTWGVPPELVLATLQAESNGDPNATNDAGEVGLMQLRPIAVQDVIEQTALTRAGALQARTAGNVQQNIQFGTAFLWLQSERWRQAGDLSYFDVLRSYVCGYQGAREDPNCARETATERMEVAGWV